MKIYKFFIALIVGMSVLFSCDADRLDLSNPNEMDPATYFTTEPQVQAAVNAIYSNLQTTGLYSRVMFFGYDNMAYENSGNSQLESDKRQYLDYSFDPSHGAIGAYWESCYRGINKANFVINNESVINLIPVTIMPDVRKKKFLGEARFLRAFYYFLLVTRFGDVPLETEIPTPESEGKDRSPASAIWALIKADLEYAKVNCLSEADEQNGRATSGAAYALLGKTHLFLEEYDDALTNFSAIYDNEYDLGTFAANFLEETEHNVESIFEIEYDVALGQGDKWNSDRTGSGLNEVTFRGQEYGFNDWFNVYPSDNLLDEFEAGDPRYAASFYSNGDAFAGGTAAIPSGRRAGWRKYQNYYKQANENQASGINFRVIRYADVLLMMAEAEALRPGGVLADAIDLMNEVRGRSMPAALYPTAEYPITNIDEFMVALEHERKVELAGEQIRINDLVRWGRLNEFITTDIWPSLSANDRAANLWEPGKELWPIPQAEIDANSSLENEDQNEAYR